MGHFAGWQRYLHLAKEGTWGTPPSDDGIYVPYARYDVRPRPRPVESQLFTGLRQRIHHRLSRAALSGTLETPLYSYYAAGKSLAQHFFEWILSAPNGIALDSYTGRFFDGAVDNKLHVGLRPNQATLSGSAESGAIRLQLDLEGKEELVASSIPALPESLPRATEFLFKDASLTLAGNPVELRSFEIRVNNNLAVSHVNSYWPTLISAGRREVRIQLSVFKTDALFDQFRRQGGSIQSAVLQLKGAHDGTGPAQTNFTLAEFDFGRLSFLDTSDQADLDSLVTQQVDYLALKPDGSANDLQLTFDAVA